MKTVHWTLSVNREEDKKKIDLLVDRGTLVRVTTICGRPVCWEYELDGARDKKTNEPVHISAWIGTGR